MLLTVDALLPRELYQGLGAVHKLRHAEGGGGGGGGGYQPV